MKCDRCDEETQMRYELHHVSFQKSPVSKIVGTYRVCPDCRAKMEADPDIEW